MLMDSLNQVSTADTRERFTVEAAVVEKVNTPRAPRKKVVTEVVEKIETTLDAAVEEVKTIVEEVAPPAEEVVAAVEKVIVEKTTLIENIKIAGTRFVQTIFKKK